MRKKIWHRLFMLCLLLLTAMTVPAYADDEEAGSLEIEVEGDLSTTYTIHIKNVSYNSTDDASFDGSFKAGLGEGNYMLSCEEVDGKTLIFETNTFKIEDGNKVKIKVKEGVAAKIYVRPTLYEDFAGTISITVKSTDDFGQEYSFTIPRYSYDYAEWSDSFYWSDFSLPEGTYEITRYIVSNNNGTYYRTYVQEKELMAVASWSAMLYSTTTSEQISADEAASVYLKDELPEETEVVEEVTETEEAESNENERKGLPKIVLFLMVLVAFIIAVVFFVFAQKEVNGGGRKNK